MNEKYGSNPLYKATKAVFKAVRKVNYIIMWPGRKIKELSDKLNEKIKINEKKNNEKFYETINGHRNLSTKEIIDNLYEEYVLDNIETKENDILTNDIKNDLHDNTGSAPKKEGSGEHKADGHFSRVLQPIFPPFLPNVC